MTTFSEQETQCPICGEKITVRHLMSTNNLGGQETDFRSHAAGFNPLYIVMNQCEVCGYSDFSHYFDEPREMSDDIKTRIRDEIKPSADAKQKISLIYATAAEIAKIREASSEEIANLYLRAAWCCRDESDASGEISYRKLAISQFENALNNREIEDKSQAVITYLIGELYRRIQDIENARTWFNRAIDLCDKSEQPEQFARLRQAAEQQRDDPKERF